MLRSTRLRKSTHKATERASNTLLVSQIVDSNVQKQRAQHVLQPVPAEPLTEPVILEQPLPKYQPPLQLYFFNSRPRIHPQSPLKVFQLFVLHKIINIIITNTNSYAEDYRET
jgi:hypothetical protein